MILSLKPVTLNAARNEEASPIDIDFTRNGESFPTAWNDAKGITCHQLIQMLQKIDHVSQ